MPGIQTNQPSPGKPPVPQIPNPNTPPGFTPTPPASNPSPNDAFFAANGPGGPSLREQLELQKLQFEVRNMKKQQDREDQLLENIRKTRLANIENYRSVIAQEEQYKEYCSHRKEDNKTYLVGQRDHRQNTHFICQRCSKMWARGPGYTSDPTYDRKLHGDDTPPLPKGLRYSPQMPHELHPNPDLIGGPIQGNAI